MRLRIDIIDAWGDLLSSDLRSIDDPIPGEGRTYFEVAVPLTAVSYRVTVDAFATVEGASASPHEGS